MEKYCTNCSSVFYATGSNKNRQKYCSKKCQVSSTQKTYYKNNEEKMFERRALQNKEWSRKTIWSIRSRSKKQGIPFNIDESDIPLVEQCPILGIKIHHTYGNKGPVGYRPDSPSVDRIKPELGYTKGNVRVISNRANLLKNNAEIWELEKILEDLKNVTKDCDM